MFFTILLVAGNTMAQAVRERTEELGVLKAIGFTNGEVLALVLAESCCWPSPRGGLRPGPGLAADRPRRSHAPALLPVFYLPAADLLIGVGLVARAGRARRHLPALQAMRLRIADALRRGG